jgi:hypothetical protein
MPVNHLSSNRERRPHKTTRKPPDQELEQLEEETQIRKTKAASLPCGGSPVVSLITLRNRSRRVLHAPGILQGLKHSPVGNSIDQYPPQKLRIAILELPDLAGHIHRHAVHCQMYGLNSRLNVMTGHESIGTGSLKEEALHPSG